MDSNMERRLTELILIARLNKQFFYKANGSKPSLVFSSEKEGWKTLLDDKETLEVSAGAVSRLRTEALEEDKDLVRHDTPVAKVQVQRFLDRAMETAYDAIVLAADAKMFLDTLDGVPDQFDDLPIELLDLDVRSYRSLTRAGIRSISELGALSPEDLIQIRNIGRNQVENIMWAMVSFDHAYPRYPRRKWKQSMTFDNFLVDSSNQEAYRMLKLAISGREGFVSPILLYGPSGCGKTHLMKAVEADIGRDVQGRMPRFLTTETFVHEMISSLKNGTDDEFRESFSTCSAVLIDHVEELAGKSSHQEELFHMLDRLSSQGIQVVLSCDVAPEELSHLTNRLRSRLQGGLVIEMRAPELETRAKFVQQTAERLGCTGILPEKAREIAQSSTDMRVLRGAVTREYFRQVLDRNHPSYYGVEGM